MTKISKIAVAVAVAIGASGLAGAASACDAPGFLANLACQTGVIDNDTAHTLDRANAAAGQPVDNAIYQAMDSYVPGSGTAAGTYARMRQNLPSIPTSAPAPAPSYNPGPGYYPQPQVRFAQVCVTNMGVAPMMQPVPVGGSCFVGTPYGPVPGVAQ